LSSRTNLGSLLIALAAGLLPFASGIGMARAQEQADPTPMKPTPMESAEEKADVEHIAPGDGFARRIDEILTRLESRNEEIRDIRSEIKLIDDDQVNLTRRTRTGSILFMKAEPNPMWMVHFDRTVADGMLGKQEWYLFDGRYLYEALERLEKVTKREFVREGERVDFFDIEQAPFPLPFGQKKEKILSNFNVLLVPPTPKDPENADHLLCIPKPDSVFDGRYNTMEFFVDRELHLPVKILVKKEDGLVTTTAEFPNLSEKAINAGVTEKDFKHPKAWRSYEEVYEPLPEQPSE